MTHISERLAMPPRSLRADAVSNVTRILDAARKVFASTGGTGSLSRVAEEAGVAAATLYRHFPTRQRLANAVYRRVIATDIEPLLISLEASDAPREAMFQIAQRITEIALRERVIVVSMDDLVAATVEALTEYQEFFERLVARGQDAGSLRKELRGSDIPAILAILVSAAALVDVDAETHRRYLGFVLDALGPRGTETKPPPAH
jgi:AcrR family transcriptional regulator